MSPGLHCACVRLHWVTVLSLGIRLIALVSVRYISWCAHEVIFILVIQRTDQLTWSFKSTTPKMFSHRIDQCSLSMMLGKFILCWLDRRWYELIWIFFQQSRWYSNIIQSEVLVEAKKKCKKLAKLVTPELLIFVSSLWYSWVYSGEAVKVMSLSETLYRASHILFICLDNFNPFKNNLAD